MPNFDLTNLMMRLNRTETILDSDGKPYMERYILWGKNSTTNKKYRGSGLYVQKLIASDKSKDLYDHSWKWGRLILNGEFNEKVRNKNSEITRSRKVKLLHLDLLNSSRLAHSIKLIDNKPVWMIFWHGSYRNQWGFWIDNKKVFWREYFGTNSKKTSRKVKLKF